MKLLKSLFLAGMLTLGVSMHADAKDVANTDVVQSEIVQVNINTATPEEISELLSGIGEKRAQAIVELREQLGGFERVEQLLDVKGIGEATLNKNRAAIKL
ncbi:ComEA family DNA-binding protein [Pleionea sediminis]|uniref:ComEA family DNA-binding protein n=1 Tax=Pleionea sediminis TaxID=2569479 RepID=UPI001184B31D|nr:helix-hairpin-helix domain-containing protein [Pleionea sediminis]